MNKNKKGFTLTEVMVVVLIIGILAAIAVPSYNFAVEKSRATQGITYLKQIAKAQTAYNAKVGNYSDKVINLTLDIKNSDGTTAKDSTFSDKFFDYKIFGDKLEKAKASRNNGEYELSVDYKTGEIFCRPATHKMCMDLGVEEGQQIAEYDTSNIQTWDLKQFVMYTRDMLVDLWDGSTCGNDLHCLSEETETLCSYDGEGTCLNTVTSSKQIIGADGYKYYWGTVYGGAKNNLAIYVNDYASRPFFAQILFRQSGGKLGVFIVGNVNHSGNKIHELAKELGFTENSSHGDWVEYRIM